MGMLVFGELLSLFKELCTDIPCLQRNDLKTCGMMVGGSSGSPWGSLSNNLRPSSGDQKGYDNYTRSS